MTTEMPALASVSELLRTALRATTAAVTEGSRRNARVAIAKRASDAELAEHALAALPPSPTAAVPHRRTA